MKVKTKLRRYYVFPWIEEKETRRLVWDYWDRFAADPEMLDTFALARQLTAQQINQPTCILTEIRLNLIHAKRNNAEIKRSRRALYYEVEEKW